MVVLPVCAKAWPRPPCTVTKRKRTLGAASGAARVDGLEEVAAGGGCRNRAGKGIGETDFCMRLSLSPSSADAKLCARPAAEGLLR